MKVSVTPGRRVLGGGWRARPRPPAAARPRPAPTASASGVRQRGAAPSARVMPVGLPSTAAAGPRAPAARGCADEPRARGDDLGVALLAQLRRPAGGRPARRPAGAASARAGRRPGRAAARTGDRRRSRRPRTSQPDDPGRRRPRPRGRRCRPATGRGCGIGSGRDGASSSNSSAASAYGTLAVELEGGQVAELGAGQQLVEVSSACDRPARAPASSSRSSSVVALGEDDRRASGRVIRSGLDDAVLLVPVVRAGRPAGTSPRCRARRRRSASTRSGRSTWRGKWRSAAAVNASCDGRLEQQLVLQRRRRQREHLADRVLGRRRPAPRRRGVPSRRGLGLQAEQAEPGVGDVAGQRLGRLLGRPCP